MTHPKNNSPNRSNHATRGLARFAVYLALLCISASTLLALARGSVAPATQSDLRHVVRAHYLMGTVFSIEVYHPDSVLAEEAIEEAFQRIRQTDELMSHYREESELSIVNREAAHRPVRIHGDLFQVLEQSQRYNIETAGAFDIATNSLGAAWRLAEERGKLLDAPQIAKQKTLLGDGRMRLDAKRQTVEFDRTGVRIDLGAIAKGWVLDRAAEVLRTHGVKSALISAGSSTLYAIGTPPGETAWSIGIRDSAESAEDSADEMASLRGVIGLHDMALSTSASSERYFVIAGRRYSHILDPRTGLPADGMLSSTVVARSAAESDALSTAVFVMGIRDGAMLLRHKGLGGLLLGQDSAAQKSTALVIPYPGDRASIAAVAEQTAL